MGAAPASHRPGKSRRLWRRPGTALDSWTLAVQCWTLSFAVAVPRALSILPGPAPARSEQFYACMSDKKEEHNSTNRRQEAARFPRGRSFPSVPSGVEDTRKANIMRRQISPAHVERVRDHRIAIDGEFSDVPKRRLTTKLKPITAITLSRISIKHHRLVYVILASKLFHYKRGDSRIGYIGTTKMGLSRIAASVAARSSVLFGCHGLTKMSVRIVVCTKPSKEGNRKSWFILERAMLLVFHEIYGRVPWCNSPKRAPRKHDVWDRLQKGQVQRIIKRLSKKPRRKAAN